MSNIYEMSNIHEQIYERFCESEPDMAKHICEYKPWSSQAIVIWFDDCAPYKVILVSEEDIDKKYGL